MGVEKQLGSRRVSEGDCHVSKGSGGEGGGEEQEAEVARGDGKGVL